MFISKITAAAFIALIIAGQAAAGGECRIIYGLFDKYQPYEWFDGEGRASGMNIDLLKAVSKQAGCDYEIVSGPWSEMLDKLKNGEITMMSVSPTAYTDTFCIYLAHSIVMYRYIFQRADTPYIRGLEELRGKTVFVIEGSFSDNALTDLAGGGLFRIERYPSHYAAIKSLSDGNGDVFISTMTAAMNVISDNPQFENIRGGVLPFLPSIYGFAVNKENMELFEIVDGAMEQLKENGEYFEIVKEWSISRDKSGWIKYAAVSTGFLIFVTLAVLLWNKSLYMQVKKKTAHLDKEIKNRINTEKKLILSSGRYQTLSDLFRTVLDTVPETIYLIEKDGRISYSNVKPRTKTLSLELIWDKITEALHENGSFEIGQISDEAGTWKVNAIAMGKGRNELLAVVSDITENVRLRDEALIQSRLAALGEMATSVAHEINNPAGLIGHNMDFINKAVSDIFLALEDSPSISRIQGIPLNALREELADSEKIIGESLLRIRDTINDLKEYGTARNNSYQKTDIKECMENAVRMSSFFIKKHTSEFSFEIFGDDFPAYANPIHIEQAVLNLIQNSCFALTDRKQFIKCVLEKTNDGGSIIITVADGGRGMTEETAKNACKAFYTTRKDSGGTGLGLSIAMRIIKEHKGTMTIKSREGKGTSVTITLPSLNEAEKEI